MTATLTVAFTKEVENLYKRSKVIVKQADAYSHLLLHLITWEIIKKRKTKDGYRMGKRHRKVFAMWMAQ